MGDLVEPAFRSVPPHTSTAGPHVARLAESAGLVLDVEQRLVLDTLLAERPDGRWVAFEGAVIAGRQNLKTRALHALVLGDLFLFGSELIVWTAHHFNTAQEAFRDIVNLIDGAPHLHRHVKAVHRARGDEGVELHDGRRLNFLARSKTGGRGLTGDRVILDEAFALTDAEMGSLLPTLSARPNPQVIYASSAGLVSSAVLRGVRDRGRPGGDPSLAYVEWADPFRGGCATAGCAHHVGVAGCALDDLDRIRRANPALGRRITVDRVLAERRALPPLEFARERLGWWDDPPTVDGAPFDVDDWVLLADPHAARGPDPVFGVDVDAGRLAHVAVAWRRPDGLVQVMLADANLSPLAAPGRVVALAGEWHGRVMLGGGAAALQPDVAGAQLVTAAEFTAACGRFDDLYRERRLRHGNQPVLNEAVRAARWRSAGSAGERALQLRDAPAVGPLAAVARALHGLLSTPTKPPAKPMSASSKRPVTDDFFGAGPSRDVSKIAF